MRVSILAIIVTILSLSGLVLAVETGDNNPQLTEDICQNTNCQKQTGSCIDGYFCFLTEASLPDDIRCSKPKMKVYIGQKITESRLNIEADPRYMEKYHNSVMDEQLSKGCLINELKPIFIEGKSYLSLTTEFINYQAKEPLKLSLNWYLVDRASKEEINVTKYCISEIALNPLEHRLVSCLITEAAILDPSYDYYATGTYTLPDGRTETKISEKAPVVSALDIATQIALAGKSLTDKLNEGANNFFGWMDAFLAKPLCDKNPDVCSTSEFCYLNEDDFPERSPRELEEAIYIKRNLARSLPTVDPISIEKGCLPEEFRKPEIEEWFRAYFGESRPEQKEGFSGNLTVKSHEAKYGRVFAKSGEKISIDISAQNNAGINSIDIFARSVDGSNILNTSYECGKKKDCESLSEISFSSGNGYLYFIYAKVNTQDGSFFTSPGGVRVFLNGWENNLPSEFDWKNAYGENWLSPLKDQGTCGSCWAFATTASMESVYKIEQGNPSVNLRLSEQNLVSCVSENQGCIQGSPEYALDYISSRGITEDIHFSYNGGKVRCLSKTFSKKVSLMRCDGTVFDSYSGDQSPESYLAQKKYTSDQWDYVWSCDIATSVACSCSLKEPCTPTNCNLEGISKDSFWTVSEYGNLPDNRMAIKKSIILNGPSAMTLPLYKTLHSLNGGFVCSEWYTDRPDLCNGLGYKKPEACFNPEDSSHILSLTGYIDTKGEELCGYYEGLWLTKNSYGYTGIEVSYPIVCYGGCASEKWVFYMAGIKKL